MGSVTCDLFQGTFCVSAFSVLNWASATGEEMLYLSIQKTKGAHSNGMNCEMGKLHTQGYLVTDKTVVLFF